jgi:hypothetical protein
MFIKRFRFAVFLTLLVFANLVSAVFNPKKKHSKGEFGKTKSSSKPTTFGDLVLVFGFITFCITFVLMMPTFRPRR